MLVQDYHFALLPRMIKERRPDARVAIFWHIPWPNPEAFGICPWQRELLDGMLGADLIGFHIQAHCNNFLQTVDRALESRIDWEHFAVNRHNHLTTVHPFPISVAFNGNQAGQNGDDPSFAERSALYRELGGKPEFIGLGVDRDRLHQRHSRAAARRGAAAGITSRLPGKVHLHSNRRTQPDAHQTLPGSGGGSGRRGAAHQPALPDRRVAADRAVEPAPQPRRNTALLPRGGRLPGDFPARRHEPGGQRICGGARR